MKYMGSKASLLGGRLGELLLAEASLATRFVDLFAGSASVSHFVAERVNVPVVSVDLQVFSSRLALSVTGRGAAIDPDLLVAEWLKPARENLESDVLYDKAKHSSRKPSRTSVVEARRLCGNAKGQGTTWSSYGGYYFSPMQALSLDHLIHMMPIGVSADLAGAALVRAASRMAAAPGHTAQPFQPNPRLVPYIESAWRRDVFTEVTRQIHTFAGRYANVVGAAIVGDATDFAKSLTSADIVFCDPPYSAAQYSRFYHVLEGIARGGWPSVSGQGRAPDRSLRSTSNFSMKRSSEFALLQLFARFQKAGCTVIMTFPSGQASNGLSGDFVRAAAAGLFQVSSFGIPHTHSTLGGRATRGDGSVGRGARRSLEELVLVLRPRKATG